MYNHFKTWVNRAYKELVLARKEWQFRNERATVSVWPRLHLSGLSALPTVGELWYGISSGTQFTIMEVFQFEEVEDDATIEATVSIQMVDPYKYENFILREDVIYESVPDKTGYIKGPGRYDFASLVTNLEDIDVATVFIHRLPEEAQDSSGGFVNNARKLEFVPWEKWSVDQEFYPWSASFPQIITETPQGTYDIYPRPDGEMTLSFDFTKKVHQLSAYNDTPLDIPEQYEDYILWGAVMEYADFDNNPKVGARALKKLEKYNYLLERDFLEMPRFEGTRFFTY